MFFRDEHPSFVDQPAHHAHVWRYMDLARYLSLLQTSALHFARADQMSDKWEGSYGQANLALRPHLYGEDYEHMERSRCIWRAEMLTSMHMNCWHLGEVESAAMWYIYQREGRGVAIRSTWGTLTDSITSERVVHGARVRYTNYSQAFIPESNAFDPFMHKRQSFSHEQEVRLIMMTGLTAPHPTKTNSALSLGPEAKVLPVSVDLAALVKDVHVAPDAPSWILELIRDVTTRYGYNFPVLQSDLSQDPIA